MKRRKTLSRKAWRVLGRLVIVLLVAVGITGILAARTIRQIYRDVAETLPPLTRLEEPRLAQTTKLFSHDGQLIATLFHENRRPVALDEVAPSMLAALMSIEDQRFYLHDGVDPMGVLRAALANVMHGGIDQGASTLTMQLARRLYLTDERSYWRKFREALLARRIEQEFTKEQILEAYLNEVYFGEGTYGVAAASSHYFGLAPDRLTPAQSAMLAGLVQSPSALAPGADPEACRRRQLSVLERMHELGYLEDVEYAEATHEAKTMKVRDTKAVQPVLKYPYFTTYAIKELSEQFSQAKLYESGFKIYTTLDIELQRMAEHHLTQVIQSMGPGYHADSAALVLIENDTGAIRAMVGGVGWSDKNQFNRAWQAARQPGSCFKAFLYTAALESGMNPEDLVKDTAVTLKLTNGQTWKPHNADGRSLGEIPLREALKRSRNLVAARLVAKLGPDRVVDVAHRCGVESDLPTVPAVALGAAEVTPLEMAQAFSTFPNAGRRHHAYAVGLVANQQGEPVANMASHWTRQALSPITAERMTEMLARVVRSGTGTGAAIPYQLVAGKTGTTDSYKDAWFVGFTPYYTCAVWVGNTDNSPTWGVFGGGLPAEIFRRVMTDAHRDLPPSTYAGFGEPTKLKLCKNSHQLASPECAETYQEVFFTSTRPDEQCDECGQTRMFLEFDYPRADTPYPEADQPELDQQPSWPQDTSQDEPSSSEPVSQEETADPSGWGSPNQEYVPDSPPVE